MLTEEDFDLFRQFRIKAMGDKCREMVDDPAYDELTFEERVKVMLDAEATARRDRKVAKLVREARFKDPSACVEDVLYLAGRKLSKDRVLRWAECRWVEECEVMVVISKSGCGKSFLSQALGNAACRRLIPVRYARLAGICEELNRARAAGDGSYFEAMDRLKNVQMLIVDDFMTTPIGTKNAVDLFEIMEAREGSEGHTHRLAARAQRVVPAHRGGADGGLHPQPHRDRRALRRPRGTQHAEVPRREEEGEGRRGIA